MSNTYFLIRGNSTYAIGDPDHPWLAVWATLSFLLRENNWGSGSLVILHISSSGSWSPVIAEISHRSKFVDFFHLTARYWLPNEFGARCYIIKSIVKGISLVSLGISAVNSTQFSHIFYFLIINFRSRNQITWLQIKKSVTFTISCSLYPTLNLRHSHYSRIPTYAQMWLPV